MAFPSSEQYLAPVSEPIVTPEDDYVRYIFPAGEPAPGAAIAPKAGIAPSPEEFSVKIPEQVIEQAPVENVYNQAVHRNTLASMPIEGAPLAKPVQSDLQSNIQNALTQRDAADKVLYAGDAAMAEFEKKQALKASQEQNALAQVQKKMDQIDAEVKNFKFDDRSLWDKSSTGQKVVLAVTGFLSSLSPNSAKAFQDNISNIMDKDLEIQKLKYNTMKEKGKELQTFYGQLVNRFGDERTADMVMQKVRLENIQNKARMMAENAQSRVVAANAMKAIELTDAQIAKYNTEIMLLAGRTAPQKIGDKFVGRFKDEAQEREFATKRIATGTAESSIDQLVNLASGAKIPFSKESSTFDVLKEKLAAEIAKANAGGKPSDVEIENAKKMIPSVYSPNFASTMQALKKRLGEDLNISAKQYGLNVIGEEIGTKK